MIKKTLLLVIPFTLVGSTFAAWNKLDDFETGVIPETYTVSSTSTLEPGVVPGKLEIVDDPVAAGQGKVLSVVNPIGAAAATNSSMVIPMGELAIKDDLLNPEKKQTLYFKLMKPLVEGVPAELNTTIGLMSSAEWETLSSVSPAPNTNELAPSWGQYSSIVRYETDGIFDIRDGGTYWNISETAQENNVWYEVWMVHSHGLSNYEVYLKGGSDFPEQTLVTVEQIVETSPGPPPVTQTSFAGNAAAYRVATFEDLDWILIKPNGGSASQPEGKDNTYIDDIYVDNSGENLSSPTGEAGPETDAEFDNISTRGNVGTGPNRLIGGFVVRAVPGADTGTVLVRAIGPGLGALGVAGTLVDPILTIFKQGVTDPIVINDNWEDNTNAAEIVTISATIGAFALEAGSADSALLLSLEPGAYTAQITGKDGGTGVALVEVYAVD